MSNIYDFDKDKNGILERLKKESPWFTRIGKSTAEVYYICLAQFVIAAGEYNQIDGLYQLRRASRVSSEVKGVLKKYYEGNWNNVIKTHDARAALLQSTLAALVGYCRILHIPFESPFDYVDNAPWSIINEFYNLAMARTRFTNFREAMKNKIEVQYQAAVAARKEGKSYTPKTPDELVKEYWRSCKE